MVTPVVLMADPEAAVAPPVKSSSASQDPDTGPPALICSVDGGGGEETVDQRRRIGKAEDLAPLALAVLSNRISAYVTGAAFVVDGGLSLTNWFDPPALDELS